MRRRKTQNAEMPLLGHIKELRKVMLISAYTIAAGTILGWVLSDYTYRFLAQPMEAVQGVRFITTTPMESIYVKLRISLVLGIVISLPIILWQVWSFILPALKKHEKKYLYFIVPWSLILFVGGSAFSYYLVLPTGLKFLMVVGGGAVDYIPFVTKSSYLNFILSFMLTFGLVFQLPVVLLLLMRLGIITPRALAKFRKWAFFIIVILAVIISPTPDLATQFLMAGPMYMLYELSIWLGYLAIRKKQKELTKVNKEEEQL